MFSVCPHLANLGIHPRKKKENRYFYCVLLINTPRSNRLVNTQLDRKTAKLSTFVMKIYFSQIKFGMYWSTTRRTKTIFSFPIIMYERPLTWLTQFFLLSLLFVAVSFLIFDSKLHANWRWSQESVCTTMEIFRVKNKDLRHLCGVCGGRAKGYGKRKRKRATHSRSPRLRDARR